MANNYTQPVIDTEQQVINGDPDGQPLLILDNLKKLAKPQSTLKQLATRQPSGVFSDALNTFVKKEKLLPAAEKGDKANVSKNEQLNIVKYGVPNPTEQQIYDYNRGLASRVVVAGSPGSSANYDPDLMQTVRELTAQSRQQIDIDQPNIDFLRQQKAQVDISPLLNWFDSNSNSKSNLLKGYEKPQTGRELSTSNIALENVLQKQREALIDSAVKQQYNRAARAQADINGKEAERENQRQFQFVEKAKTEIDKISQKYTSIDSQVNRMQDLISRGKYREVQQMLPTFAKFISGTVGSQSDKDLALQQAPGVDSILTKITDFVTSNKTTNMNAHQLAPFMENIKAAADQVKMAHRNDLNYLWKTQSAAAGVHGFGGLTSEDGLFKKMFDTEAERTAPKEWWEKELSDGKAEALILKPNEDFYEYVKPKQGTGGKKIDPKTGKPYHSFGDHIAISQEEYKSYTPEMKAKLVKLPRPPQLEDLIQTQEQVQTAPIMQQRQNSNGLLDENTMNNLQQIIRGRR